MRYSKLILYNCCLRHFPKEACSFVGGLVFRVPKLIAGGAQSSWDDPCFLALQWTGLGSTLCVRTCVHACKNVCKIKHRKFILRLQLTIRATDILPDLLDLASVSPFKKKLFFSNISSIIPLTYLIIHYKSPRITIKQNSTINNMIIENSLGFEGPMEWGSSFYS